MKPASIQLGRFLEFIAGLFTGAISFEVDAR
jgi:hypothetical protein